LRSLARKSPTSEQGADTTSENRVYRHSTAVFALTLAAAACLAPRSTGASGERPAANAINREEIEQAGAANAYDLIQKLRPLWFRARGPTSFRDPVEIGVYVNEVHVGSLAELRNYQTEEIAKLEFLDARRATYRFGPGNVHGAIVLTTRTTAR